MEENEDKFKKRRAILHILTGILILLFAYYYQGTRWILFYSLIIGIILSFLSIAFRIPIICWFLDTCELPRHKKTFPGKSLLFFLAGSLLVIKLFPQDIALASIAILTFADPVSYFSSNLGKKIGRKSIPGILLTLLVAFLSSLLFISWKYAIPASIMAILAETLIIKVWEDYIDDNFLIPIVAGTTIYIMRMIY